MNQLSSARPTRLPHDNHRVGSSTFLRPPSVTLGQRTELALAGSLLLINSGLGADTAVLEYQPVVHRLRLSASP
jgi:hypothetical protein